MARSDRLEPEADLCSMRLHLQAVCAEYVRRYDGDAAWRPAFGPIPTNELDPINGAISKQLWGLIYS